MIICAVGVFIDISVITAALIVLAIGKKAGYHKEALLLAMIGGGKAGNIISPNPNTIAVSEAFKVDLTSLMMKNFILAICAVVVTILLSTMLSKKQGVQVTENDLEQKEDKNLPSFIQAVAGPVVVVILLAPIAGILMAGATASTTAGATVIDSLPHGSFFHATGWAAGLEIKERMKLIPYEMCVGLTSTVVAVMMYVI